VAEVMASANVVAKLLQVLVYSKFQWLLKKYMSSKSLLLKLESGYYQGKTQ
jgi:hypothetical protein